MPVPPLLPLIANWREPVAITYAFMTEIITSYAGREQRRALRRIPRISLSYSSMLVDDTRRAFNTLMAGGSAREFGLLDPVRSGAVSTSGMIADGIAISVASVPAWLVEGRLVTLVDGDRRQLRRVEALAGPALTLDAAAGDAWPVGTEVRPAFAGRLSRPMSLTAPASHVSEAATEFAVAAASEPVDAGSAGTLFDGIEVWAFRPNWAEPFEFAFEQPRYDVDFERGRVAHFLPSEFESRLTTGTYLGRDAGEVDAMQAFFVRMRGRASEFWLPGEGDDLPLRTGTASGSAVLRIVGQDKALPLEEDTVRRAVAIHLLDGTVLYRKISDVAAVNDEIGADTLITCAATMGTSVSPATVLRIAWMTRARFASDEVTFEWMTRTIAQVSFSFQGLEDLPND